MTEARESPIALFEKARPRLWGLAYRMLGSAADADDAVQDTWLRWQGTDSDGIDNPEAWLTTTCSRRCIDMLRAAHRTRVDYFGPWLPEPLVGDRGQEPDDTAELASSLSMAFMLLLERLTPAERAAYLLHDVFDYDYNAIASALDKQPAACRQLVSRARKNLSQAQTRFERKPGEDRSLLEAFLAAIRSGEIEPLETLLAKDAELWTDGGGKIAALRQVIHGPENISCRLNMIWQVAWHSQEFIETVVNGEPGLILREDGNVSAILTLAVSPDGLISGIYIVRNPDKLGLTSASTKENNPASSRRF